MARVYTAGYEASDQLNPYHTAGVLGEVFEERGRQDARWGEQNHPDGTGPDVDHEAPGNFYFAGEGLELARDLIDAHVEDGDLAWIDILDEEYWEVAGEGDTQKLRTELIQLAAVAVAWVQAIDRRGA